MFSLIRAAEDRHLVDRGQVSCPLRERDAEADFCLQCRWAQEVRVDGEPPFVRCRPPARLLLLP
jgi:hypothetical protein